MCAPDLARCLRSLVGASVNEKSGTHMPCSPELEAPETLVEEAAPSVASARRGYDRTPHGTCPKCWRQGKGYKVRGYVMVAQAPGPKDYATLCQVLALEARLKGRARSQPRG